MTTLIAHDFTVGEILTAATMDGTTADDGTLNSDKLEMKTGQYTGDGNATQAITDLGIAPQFLWIWEYEADTNPVHMACTTDTLVDNDADGLAYNIPDDGTASKMLDHMIASLDSDGFTVAGNGAAAMNFNGQVYEYMALGA